MSELRSQHGREVEAEDILKDAENPRSPLHDPLFHFGDDTKAAQQYRSDLARRMVTSLVFNIVMTEGAEPVQMPAFINISPPGGRAQFDHTLVAFKVEEARNRVVESAWRQFEALKRRFENLSELKVIFEAIEKTKPAKASQVPSQPEA